MSTGDVNYAVGPNASNATTGPANYNVIYTDSVLTEITDTIIYDYVALEFEFEAPSDVVEFDYIFLSEEYNEFIGSPYI